MKENMKRGLSVLIAMVIVYTYRALNRDAVFSGNAIEAVAL